MLPESLLLAFYSGGGNQMKILALALAGIVLSSGAMAQGVPGLHVPNTAPLTTGKNQLQYTGNQLILSTSVLPDGLAGPGRFIIEKGVDPTKGILNNIPAQIPLKPIQ